MTVAFYLLQRVLMHVPSCMGSCLDRTMRLTERTAGWFLSPLKGQV